MIESKGQNPTWKNIVPEKVKVLRYVESSRYSLLGSFIEFIWRLSRFIQRVLRVKFSLFNMFFTDTKLQKKKFPKSEIDCDQQQVITHVPDKYSLIGLKTLETFELVLDKFDFDYIYRTNVSSYVDLKKLSEYISDQSKTSFYAGFMGRHSGIRFVSGSGYFLSRDLVMKILANRHKWDHGEVDDVALGKILNELGVQITEIGRTDILDPIDFDAALSRTPLESFHFRCKTKEPSDSIQIMTRIHSHFNL